MKKQLIAITTLFTSYNICAQDSTEKNKLAISGYAELYYSYDFNRPQNNTKPSFIYNYNRNNEVTVNFAMLKASYNEERIRATIAIAAGTYVNANYSSEPGVLKNLYEVNAGIKLSRKSNLWIDAGIFGSHLGWESAIGKDNWTLTRSLAAENSPYFETGAKLSYTTANDKWFLSALILNGWQRIQRVDGNTTPAFGTQVTYKPNANVLLNYSTYVGNDKPDSARQMRYFNNIYGVFQFGKHFTSLVGFDYGLEQQQKGSTRMNSWYTSTVLLKYTPDSKNTIAIRGEYYSDPEGVIVSTGTQNGFKTIGWSINYDRQVMKNAIWHTEIRQLNSKDYIFNKQADQFSNNNLFITTSMAVAF